jgi:hypothetical protein
VSGEGGVFIEVGDSENEMPEQNARRVAINTECFFIVVQVGD